MFKKGKSGNPKGRPKGCKSKIKADLESKVKFILESNFDRIQEDIDSLSPSERVKAVIALLPYVMAKKQSVSIEEQKEKERESLLLMLDSIPDETINLIVDKIKEYGTGLEERGLLL